jgi:Flp pilus assembly pilin Flp
MEDPMTPENKKVTAWTVGLCAVLIAAVLIAYAAGVFPIAPAG